MRLPRAHAPHLKLSPAEELAAVSHFLASLPQNAIPHSTDPMHPIDPSVVLDFDTRHPDAAVELKAITQEVWVRNPVILFCSLHSSVSREIKAILGEMNLDPPPTIFDVDQRADAHILTPLLARLTSTPGLPILLIGGEQVGSIAHIRELNHTGELRRSVSAAGAVLDSYKKKRKRH